MAKVKKVVEPAPEEKPWPMIGDIVHYYSFDNKTEIQGPFAAIVVGLDDKTKTITINSFRLHGVNVVTKLEYQTPGVLQREYWKTVF
jgi:hypothetical protein